jgi:hypothetical protein
VPAQLASVVATAPQPPAQLGPRPGGQSKNPFMGGNPFGRPKAQTGRPRQQPQQQQRGQTWRGGPAGPQVVQVQGPPPPPQLQAPPDCARVSCPTNTMCVADPRTAGYTVMCAAPDEACAGPGNVQCKETKVCVKDPRVNW